MSEIIHLRCAHTLKDVWSSNFDTELLANAARHPMAVILVHRNKIPCSCEADCFLEMLYNYSINRAAK